MRVRERRGRKRREDKEGGLGEREGSASGVGKKWEEREWGPRGKWEELKERVGKGNIGKAGKENVGPKNDKEKEEEEDDDMDWVRTCGKYMKRDGSEWWWGKGVGWQFWADF